MQSGMSPEQLAQLPPSQHHGKDPGWVESDAEVAYAECVRSVCEDLERKLHSAATNSAGDPLTSGHAEPQQVDADEFDAFDPFAYGPYRMLSSPLLGAHHGSPSWPSQSAPAYAPVAPPPTSSLSTEAFPYPGMQTSTATDQRGAVSAGWAFDGLLGGFGEVSTEAGRLGADEGRGME